ncbi:MAG: ABC transporter ATP-binding protein, partial [Defluviitaleaceae bacterium]|nr:ABC transporter ATP-binding protein [Defluviitaleaceae bacterium]
MIEIKNMAYAYNGGGKGEVLKDISFDVQPGECVGILGNNGAGKSTLITCLCKIRKPNSGSVCINGQDIYKLSRTESARFISYVAQKSEISQMTVFDAVLLGRKPYIKLSLSPDDMDICEKTLDAIGLSAFKLRYINELSGGELQKVMLARAIVQQPKLLLLDEPTSNLDPKNQYEMLAFVRKLAKETDTSVLMVLHDINLALRFCDKFLFLKHGSIYKYGNEEVVTEEALANVY